MNWQTPKHLKILVSRIPDTGLELNESLGASLVSDLLFEPGKDIYWKAIEPASIEFQLKSMKDHVELVGHGEFTLETSCVRCLQDNVYKLKLSLHVFLMPHQAESQVEDDVADSEDERTVFYYEDHTIDLCKILREEIFLALPVFPDCDDAAILSKKACNFGALQDEMNARFGKNTHPFAKLGQLGIKKTNEVN